MKLSVYLPNELAERLRGVKDDLNVSEVCQAALGQAVSAAEVARLGDMRPRIIERLRRSRTPEEDVLDRGRSIGRRWASDAATLADLKAVACSSARDVTLGGAVERVRLWHQTDIAARLGTPTRVAEAVLGGIAAMGGAAQARQPTYLQGFRQGALEVWESVRSELEA